MGESAPQFAEQAFGFGDTSVHPPQALRQLVVAVGTVIYAMSPHPFRIRGEILQFVDLTAQHRIEELRLCDVGGVRGPADAIRTRLVCVAQ
jgi:hypothetical protein